MEKIPKCSFRYGKKLYVYITANEQLDQLHRRMLSFAILDGRKPGELYKEAILLYISNNWSQYFIVDDKTPFVILWKNIITIAKYKETLGTNIIVPKEMIIEEILKKYMIYRRVVIPKVVNTALETNKENIIETE